MRVLRWAREVAEPPCPWDTSVCIEAAETGDIELLRYLIGARAPRDSWVCAGAAITGQLAALQFCREHLFPWGDDTLAGAVEARQLHVVRWLLERSCPAHARTRIQAKRLVAAAAPASAEPRHFTPMDDVVHEGHGFG